MPKSSISYEKFFEQSQLAADEAQENFEELQPQREKQFEISDFRVNDWVVVIFNKKWYPGYIQKISKNKLIVQFADRKGTKIFWPSEIDRQTWYCSQILCKINHLTEFKNEKGESILRMDQTQFKYVDNCVKNCIIYN